MPIGLQTNVTAFPPSPAASYARAAAKEDGIAVPSSRQTPDSLRVGFGDNSISIGAAAVKTVTTNLREARRLVPSLQDIREVRDQRLTQLRAEQAEAAVRAGEAARAARELLERRIPEADPRARAFETVQEPTFELTNQTAAPVEENVAPTALQPATTPTSSLLQPSQQLDVLV